MGHRRDRLNKRQANAIETRQAIEQGRLARAVGPDQPHDLPLFDAERHLVQGDDAPKTQADVFNRQQRRR